MGHAHAPAFPAHAAGPLGPAVAHAVQAGAGNAAVVGLLQSSGVLARKRAPGAAPAETDPLSDFVSLATQLRGEELPALQRAFDALDAQAAEEVGVRVLMLWSAIEGAHGSMAGDGAALPEYERLSEHALQAVTTQRFRGTAAAGAATAVKAAETDATGQLARLIKDAVTTVGDTKDLLELLRLQERTTDQEALAVRLLHKHPNPWQLGFMRAAVKAEKLEPALEGFSPDQHQRLTLIFEAQGLLLTAGAVGPADRVGILEARPRERTVHVLRPYGAREIAVELYSDPAAYERILAPYNRALAAIGPDGWVPAGTALVVEPRLLTGRYQMAFMTGELARPQLGGPWLQVTPDGSAVKGTEIRYGVRWNMPEAPPGLKFEPPPGITIVLETAKPKWADVEWEILHDPVAVSEGKAPESKWIGSDTHPIEDLEGEKGASITHAWPALGTHTVVCRVTFGPREPFLPNETVELRHPQPVLTRDEKVEADWLTVHDTRGVHLFSQPDNFDNLHAAAEAAGVTDEEVLANPMLARDLGVELYPEFLLKDLRARRDATKSHGVRKDLEENIAAVERAMKKTRSFGLRPLKALYVSGANEKTASYPLSLYLSPDPDDQWHSSLVLYDMSIPGDPREYHGGRFQPNFDAAIDVLLAQFADDAPYPTGTVRFHVDSGLLPADMTSDPYPIRSRTITHETDGGMALEKLAGIIFAGSLLVVGSLTVGPEVALPAFAVYGAVSGLAGILDRLDRGEFEWDMQTGLDILSIVGGLTAVAAPVISAVRGVGSVAWLGRVAKLTDYTQIGVMAGMHADKVTAAIKSGDNNRIVDSVLAAVADGAMVVVVDRGPRRRAAAASAVTTARSSIRGSSSPARRTRRRPPPAATRRPARHRVRSRRRARRSTRAGRTSSGHNGWPRPASRRASPSPTASTHRSRRATTRRSAASASTSRRRRASLPTRRRSAAPRAARSASSATSRPASTPSGSETPTTSASLRRGAGRPRSIRTRTRRTS